MAIKARHARIFVQALFLVSFLALFWLLTPQWFPGSVASLLLALDPLTAVSVALSDWTLPRWTWIGVVVLALTALLGRFFCGWICPLGSLQQLVSWISGPDRRKRAKINRYRSWFVVKYFVLIVLAVWAVAGTNHFGWLDPLSLLHRAVASGLRPLWRGVAVPGGLVAFGMLVAILVMSTWMPRFFCRAVCPLGALLGLFARLAPFHIRRADTACSGCTLCVIACQGADDPLDAHRVSECHVCLNCLDVCPDSSLSFGAAEPPALAGAGTPSIDIGRRRFAIAASTSALLVPAMRVAGGSFTARSHDAIRPPGAAIEESFLARCITCGACAASCPTGVIISDLGRTGIEGLFTPVLHMRRGWCEPSCIRCGEVCPTDAIAVLDPLAKQAIGGPAEVTVGTAFVDRGRCLPWAMETPCIVCEEMCPTSPKAILLERIEAVRADGSTVVLQQPRVVPELCTGCGLCENRCPVGERAAIRVSSIGETRDPRNRMLQVRTTPVETP